MGSRISRKIARLFVMYPPSSSLRRMKAQKVVMCSRNTARSESREFTDSERNLPHPSQLIHRPVPEDGLAVNIALVDGAEIAAVVRHGAMVAEHEEAIHRHGGFRVRTGIGISGRDIVLIE